MIEIRQICKKDIPALFEDTTIWNHSFLSISKHRLLSHSKNPNSSPDDVVLLLAYLNSELVGYMGVFVDTIILDNLEQKIGWLSTWWVHPKTLRSGTGREILNTAYNIYNGKVGISQFTKSARKVYDRTGNFYTLKENIGVKAVLRSTTSFLIPMLYPKYSYLKNSLKIVDSILNNCIDLKLYFQKKGISKQLDDIKIEYLNKIDAETNQIINTHNNNHIAKKSNEYFEWLKAYQWVQEAPLLDFTERSKYEFSIYDESFNIYLVKILKENICIGFLVLQKRNKTIKVLFTYYDEQNVAIISNIIKLHAINQKINEVICYDTPICNDLKKSNIFIYNRIKIKNSIISKAFNKSNFDDVTMNYGDGDCCFA
jgi:hypothetical protein